MSNTRNIFNFHKRYRVLASDMTSMQQDWSDNANAITEGIFNGSIVKGLAPATGGALSINISAGMAFGPTGYVHNVTSITPITVTPPTGTNYARSLVVARPKLTNNSYMVDPENPFSTFPLKVELGSEVILVPGTAASAPSYPSLEANDVVVCGLRTYPGQTVVTIADIDMSVRDSMGKNADYLQNAAQFDDRLRPYRLSNQVLGVKPSQSGGSGPRQFKAASNNRAAIFPKTPAGAFNQNDTYLNFQTGAITGGDGSSSAFTPTVPSSGNCIVATVVLTKNNTLSVSYGTAGTRDQCNTGIKNQQAVGAGSVNIPTTGQPIAFVLLFSANGATITELDFFDARGILQGGGGGAVSGIVNFITNGDFEQSSPGTVPENWSTYNEFETVTFTDAGDLVTITAGSTAAPAAGETVSFAVISSTTGISTNTLYYVINPSGLTCQLSLTLGGAAIALTTNGNGTMFRGKPKTGSQGTSQQVTFLATSTNPLDGTMSAVFAKDAANRMGQGAKCSFTVPLGWRAARLTTLRCLLGTNVTGYNASDLTFWIYDVDNATMITPYVTGIPKINNGFNISFLTSTSANYLLLVHVSTPNTTAYSCYFDDFVIDPMPAGNVTSAQGLIEKTNTFTLGAVTTAPTLGSGTTVFRETYRQGSYALVRWELRQTVAGSAGSGDYLLPLPSGLSIDYTRACTLGANAPIGDVGSGTLVGSTYYDLRAYVLNSGAYINKVFCWLSNEAVQAANWSSATGSLATSSLVLSVVARIPIVGWTDELNVGPGAQPEYLYNSSTSTTTDSSSFASGDKGVLIQAFAPSGTNVVSKRVRSQSPIQSDDVLILETDCGTNAVAWQSIQDATIGFLDLNAGAYYGAGFTVLNSYEINVNFYSRATPATLWSAIATWRWRLRKCKANNATGFGLATAAGEAGLVNPYVEGSGVVYSGKYTPVATSSSPATVITAGITALKGFYTRVGKLVTVTIQARYNASAAGVTDVLFTLPIASNFTAITDLQGVATNSYNGAASSTAGRVVAAIAAKQANIVIVIGNVTDNYINMTFQYEVI